MPFKSVTFKQKNSSLFALWQKTLALLAHKRQINSRTHASKGEVRPIQRGSQSYIKLYTIKNFNGIFSYNSIIYEWLTELWLLHWLWDELGCHTWKCVGSLPCSIPLWKKSLTFLWAMSHYIDKNFTLLRVRSLRLEITSKEFELWFKSCYERMLFSILNF